MKTINLTQQRFAIVDDDDYERLNKYKWRYSTGYAMRAIYVKGKKQIGILMHREIINARVGMEVDHINRDRLDNRKSNLRECTRLQNEYNKTVPGGTSKYKGVSKGYKDSWNVQIRFNGKNHSIGSYKSEEEAARKYNEYALIHQGEFAVLNDV